LDIGTEAESGRLAFTGIHIIQPELLSYIPDSGPSDIIDCYRGLIDSGIPVKAFISKGHYWRDIGSIDSYILSNKEMLGNESFKLGTGLIMAPDVELKDWCVVGNNVSLGKGVSIERSILWDNVIVKDGVTVKDSVVTYSGEITSDIITTVY
jgi:mannose-1-phosphate guanylyltransferase